MKFIIFLIFYILIIIYIFLPSSDLNNWSFFEKIEFKIKKEGNIYKKKDSSHKDYNKFNGKKKFVADKINPGKLDLIIIDIDVNSPCWIVFNKYYKKYLFKNPYVVSTMNNGYHFYYSYSKSKANGLKINNSYVHNGGILGFDTFLNKNDIILIYPTKVNIYGKTLEYKWINKRFDFKDTSKLPVIPENIIKYINYLSEYNFISDLDKSIGYNIKKIRKLKEYKNLIIFWSPVISEYYFTNKKYNYTKKIGKYLIKNNLIFLQPENINLWEILKYFNPDNFISVQYGYSDNDYELGCLRQSKELLINNEIQSYKPEKQLFGYKIMGKEVLSKIGEEIMKQYIKLNCNIKGYFISLIVKTKSKNIENSDKDDLFSKLFKKVLLKMEK